MNVINKTGAYANRFRRLNDQQAKSRILNRIDRAENWNFGDHHSIGGGVYEMRIDYGPGYRIYFAQEGGAVYLLLIGGDKRNQGTTSKKPRRCGTPSEGKHDEKKIGKILFAPEEIGVTPYETVEFLDSKEAIAEYLAISLEDPDSDIFLKALGNVLRAKGVANVAKEAGLAREALYRTCRLGKKPHFNTIMKITRAIGIPLGFPASVSIKQQSGQSKRRGKRAAVAS